MTPPSPDHAADADPFLTDHLHDDLRGRAVRGGAATVGGQVGETLLHLASTVLLARLLVPRDFGLIAMVTAVTGLVGFFKDLGLTQAVVQRPQIKHGQISTLFWINAAVTVMLAILVAGLAPLVGWFYGEPDLVAVTMVFGAFLILGGLGAQHQALLTRQMRFGRLVTAELLSLSMGVLVAVILATGGAGYWALVSLTGVQAAVHTALVWRFAQWSPGRPQRGSGVRELLRFGANLTGFNLVNYLARNGDNVLIGWARGAGALGLYTKAYSLLLLPLGRATAPLTRVAVPALSRLQDEPARYRDAYLRMAGVSCVLGCSFVAFALSTSEWIIAVLLGQRWASAAPIFSWLAVVGLVQPLSQTTGWILISQGRTAEMFRVGLAGAAVSLASFVIGLPHGPVGVAAAYGISGLLVRTPVLLWYVGRRGPVSTRDFFQLLRFPLAVSAIVAAASGVARLTSPSEHPLVNLVYAGVLAGVASAPLFHFAQSGRRFTAEIRVVAADIRVRKGRTDV